MSDKKKPKWRETVEAISIAILIALFLRAFFVEAFKIPSSSMVPNLKIGDHIFVNKYIYGLRIPFTLKRLVSFKKPKRGEVFIFNYPDDPSKDYIKRVVGLPGDRILINDEKVTVNGSSLKKIPLTEEETKKYLNDIPNEEEYQLYREESSDSISYVVMYRKDRMFGYMVCKYCDDGNGNEIVVPEHMYFAMGDNRDNSSDSRVWGFVPEEYVKGRALFIWLSLNSDKPTFWFIPSIRWERFGRLIK
jgi:signal peptidase I